MIKLIIIYHGLLFHKYVLFASMDECKNAPPTVPGLPFKYL